MGWRRIKAFRFSIWTELRRTKKFCLKLHPCHQRSCSNLQVCLCISPTLYGVGRRLWSWFRSLDLGAGFLPALNGWTQQVTLDKTRQHCWCWDGFRECVWSRTLVSALTLLLMTNRPYQNTCWTCALCMEVLLGVGKPPLILWPLTLHKEIGEHCMQCRLCQLRAAAL